MSYKYKRDKYDILKERIERIDWDELSKNGSAKEVKNKLKSLLINFKEHNIPKCMINKDKEIPWLLNKIKRLIKRKQNALKRFRKLRRFYFKVKYNQARNLLTKQIRLAKLKYEKKIIMRAKNNRKIFYSYITTKNRKTGYWKVGPLRKSRGVGGE